MIPKRRYLSPNEKVSVRIRQKDMCACGCREPLDDGVQYDHVLALHLGGTNDLDNFQALKPKHHAAKSTRELKNRAKVVRIREQGGLLKKKKSSADKYVEKLLMKRAG